MHSREEFAAHVGEVFSISPDENAGIDLTLTEVVGVGPKTTQEALDAGRAAPFSAVFRGPPEPLLPQATHRLSHAKLGDFDLFLVPIGPDGDGIGYEAAFS